MKIYKFLIVFAAFFGLATPCFAHPHIWGDFSANAKYNATKLTSVEIVVEFDRNYSQTTFSDYDENKNGKLDKDEKSEMVVDFTDFFSANKYYLSLQINKKNVKIAEPKITSIDINAKKIIVMKIEIRPNIPLKFITEKPLEIFFSDKHNYIAYMPILDGSLEPTISPEAGITPKFNLAIKLDVDPNQILIIAEPLSGATTAADNPATDKPDVKNPDIKNPSSPKPDSGKTPAVKLGKKLDLKNKLKSTRELTFSQKLQSYQAKYNRFIQDKIAEIAESLSAGGIFLIFLLCIALGFGHAAAPGHGKSIALAYFTRRHAKPYQAFVFGATVALAHTGTAFLLSLVLYLFRIFKVIKPGSNPLFEINFIIAIIFIIIGAVLLIGAFRDLKHQHHEISQNEIAGKGLFRVAIAGGIIPCPLSIIILTSSIATGVFWLGAISVIGIAIGTALLISLAGLLVITGRAAMVKKMDDESPAKRKFHLATGFISAFLILFLGLGLATFYMPGSIIKWYDDNFAKPEVVDMDFSQSGAGDSEEEADIFEDPKKIADDKKSDSKNPNAKPKFMPAPGSGKAQNQPMPSEPKPGKNPTNGELPPERKPHDNPFNQENEIL